MVSKDVPTSGGSHQWSHSTRPSALPPSLHGRLLLPRMRRPVSLGVPTPGSVRVAVSPALRAHLPFSTALGHQARALGDLVYPLPMEAERTGMCILEPKQERRKTHAGQEHRWSRHRPPRAWKKSCGQRPRGFWASRRGADGPEPTQLRWTGAHTARSPAVRQPRGPHKQEHLTAPGPGPAPLPQTTRPRRGPASCH